jgi:hypothetical protein
MSESTNGKGGGGCLIFLFVIGLAIYFGYQWLDSIGWISHQEDTIITARSDWLVGESKECWSSPVVGDVATHLRQAEGYAMSYVACDDGPEHKMSVKFYGRKLQGVRIVTWRCMREETSFLNDNTFTCYETGAHD